MFPTVIRSPLPFNPERITESVLSLTDMAVVVTRNSNQIVYCSQSIVTVLGVSNEQVMQEGRAFLNSCSHPADQEILIGKLFPSLRNFLRTLPESVRKACIFNYTARMRHSNGRYILVAFENQPMEWSGRSWPTLYMTVIKNITPFGNKQKMILNVSTPDENKRYKSAYHQEYDLRWEPFTIREAQIIRALANGLTSKQIAADLHLSVETVRNHRKHIMCKSGCVNSADVAMMAIREGML